MAHESSAFKMLHTLDKQAHLGRYTACLGPELQLPSTSSIRSSPLKRYR
uniref:Uncharacterized protein n=1 Tax=Arundo donax TaxID=35708 RepID=A0A0A9G6E6_ARUDO